MAWTIPASSPFAGPTAIRGRLHFQIKNRGDQSAKKQNHSEPNQPTAAEHEVQTERIAGHYLASEFAGHEPSGKMRGTLMALRLFFSAPLPDLAQGQFGRPYCTTVPLVVCSQPLILANDAREADMAHRCVDGLRVARGRSVAAAVIRRAQV
jgi:hypothetical protein